MSNSFYRYHISKLNQNQINNLNRCITSKQIEAIIDSLPINTSTEKDGFSAEFYHILEEEIIPLLLKLFHKVETYRTLPIFYEITASLILNPQKDSKKKVTDQSLS